MLTANSLIDKFPASSSQLKSLIAQLSGHAENLVPVDQMLDIASALASYSPDLEIYGRLDLTDLANVLVRLFESLSDVFHQSNHYQ